MFNITVQPHIRLLTLAFEFILQNLGIQCVRRKDAPASLAQREKIQVDPFKQGFMHANMAINLNAIRLCFQVKYGFIVTQTSVADGIIIKLLCAR